MLRREKRKRGRKRRLEGCGGVLSAVAVARVRVGGRENHVFWYHVGINL